MATATVGVRMEEALKEHLRMAAEREGKTLSDYCANILERHLDGGGESAHGGNSAAELEFISQAVDEIGRHIKNGGGRDAVLQELRALREDFDEHRRHFRKAVAATLQAIGDESVTVSSEQAKKWVKDNLMPKKEAG